MSDSESEDTSAAKPDVPQDPAPSESKNAGDKKVSRRKTEPGSRVDAVKQSPLPLLRLHRARVAPAWPSGCSCSGC